MADILNSAQPTDNTLTVSPPNKQPAETNLPVPEPPKTSEDLLSVPPEPAPTPLETVTTSQTTVPSTSDSVPTADSLIVPPKQEGKPPAPPTKTSPPPPPNTPIGKKKSVTGVILAAVLLLFITLPLAIYEVSQTQQLADVRSRAAYPSTPTPAPQCPGVTNWGSPGALPSLPVDCRHYNGSVPGPVITKGFKGECAFYHCPNNCTGTCGDSDPNVWLTHGPCNSGQLGSNECGQIDTVDDNLAYCAPTMGCDTLIRCGGGCQGKPAPTSSITPSHSPTPTITTTITPTPSTISCPVIQVYKCTDSTYTQCTLVTDSEYSTLEPNDYISIWVGPTATQISINGAAYVNLTTKNSQGFWVTNVQIPIDRTNFNIAVK